MLNSFNKKRDAIPAFTSTNDKKEILSRLTSLGVEQNCIEKVMKTVNEMTNSDHVKGALNFLTQATATKSIREAYYTHSDYIAEYFCTISNLGLFAVAFYYDDYATLLAATFSALSHAIPSQRLHDLDMLGVFLVLGKVGVNYQLLLNRPDIIAWGAGAIGVQALDVCITRKHLDKVGPWIHVAWHLAVALALHKFNSAQLEVTAEDILSISTQSCITNPPSFLADTYNMLSQQICDLASKNKCSIL